jgi:hypothetical protein
MIYDHQICTASNLDCTPDYLLYVLAMVHQVD